jgi:hypothetical protein
MCEVCKSLTAAVKRAKREGNAEKIRVMQKLLDQHQAQHVEAQLRQLWGREVVVRG